MSKRIPVEKTVAAWLLVIPSLVLATPTMLANTPAGAWQTEVVDPTGCQDPSLAVDSAGLPRISYGPAGKLKYARHDGSTWQLELVEEQWGSTGWHSSLVLDSLDAPHISYYSPYSSTLMYTHYYSDSWHIETVGDTYDIGGQTSLALDSSSRPHIAYWDYTHLTVGYTYYDGVDWQFDTVATMTTRSQSVTLALALDSANRPHLCYYDSDTDVLTYAYHNGATWQSDAVDEVFYNGQECSIALDSHDHAHISYRDLGVLYARQKGSSWEIMTVDDDFFAGQRLSLALDSSERPHVSYTDSAVPEHELRYAYWTGQSWRIEVVDVAGEDRRFDDTSLALDDDNRPHIGYWDLGNPSTLKYAVRDSVPTINRVYLPLIARQN